MERKHSRMGILGGGMGMNMLGLMLMADAFAPQPTKHRSEQKAAVKQQQPLATFRKHPGHKIWELDMKSKEVNEVPFTGAEVDLNGEVKKRIECKPYFLYCSALNQQNALKKFIKIIEEKEKGG